MAVIGFMLVTATIYIIGRTLAREAALDRLTAIVESSSDAVIDTALDGRVLRWNSAAVAMYRRRQEDILGKSILTLVPEEGHAELMALRAAVARDGISRASEGWRVRPDGSRFYAAITLSPSSIPADASPASPSLRAT